MQSKSKFFVGMFGAFSAVLFMCSASHADVKQIKAYKEAFPDEKLKCTACHMDKMPKKEDGQHEFNDYGKKVFSLKKGEQADAETYKEAGKIPQ